jgi:hypothetical protein
MSEPLKQRVVRKTDTEAVGGLARLELCPTEVTEIDVSQTGDLVQIRFSDGGESVRGSLILSTETAAALSEDLAETVE